MPRPKIETNYLPQPITYFDRDKELLENMKLWQCRYTINGQMLDFLVEPEYMWDGGTIPSLTWSLLKLHPMGIMEAPSLPHDILCDLRRGIASDKVTILYHGEPFAITQDLADRVFWQSLKYLGINKTKAWLMWRSVRRFQRIQCRLQGWDYKLI